MVKAYVPDVGDIVYLDFNPQAGHEQAGHRPAIVLTPKAYNEKTSLCIACPITNSIKGYPFEVDCNSLDVTGVILADQVKSFDWKARNVAFKGRASRNVIEEIKAKLMALLGF